MIYLVTNNKELFDTDDYKIISIEESLKLLEPLQIVGLDTETEGLDPYTKKLLLLQLGCLDFQVVIDCRTIDPKEYKDYLESDREFLGWNLKFDLKFLYHQGIYPKKVYDGFLAEKLMWLGYPNGMHGMSLKSAGEQYLGIELDKSVRGKIIWSQILTSDIIIYGANDVKYLEQIKDKQMEELEKRGLTKAIYVENNFILSLAYCEYCGIYINQDKWKQKIVNDIKREEGTRDLCNKWLLENDPNSPYITTDLQGNLFTGFSTDPIVTLNWNSDKQVKPIFKKFGLNLEVFDKKTKELKESVEEKVLLPQADKCSLVPLYIAYKKANKVTTTYGETFLDLINPISNRLHTNFNPLGTDTGRLSSGGKDKAAGVEYINMQNIPADAFTRSCFSAEPGNKWISIDYSGQETYVMASVANDKAIIKELMEGSGDIHSLTAYMSYHEIPRDTPIKDIKKLYPHLRQEAKGIEFAINKIYILIICGLVW